MIGTVVHLTVKIIIGKGATGDSILASRVYDKTDPPHLVQQSVYIMFQFIVQLVLIKRNDLIEVDLLAARQSADLAAILRIPVSYTHLDVYKRQHLLHLVIKTGHVRKAATVNGEHLSHVHINGSFKSYFSMILFSKAS